MKLEGDFNRKGCCFSNFIALVAAFPTFCKHVSEKFIPQLLPQLPEQHRSRRPSGVILSVTILAAISK